MSGRTRSRAREGRGGGSGLQLRERVPPPTTFLPLSSYTYARRLTRYTSTYTLHLAGYSTPPSSSRTYNSSQPARNFATRRAFPPLSLSLQRPAMSDTPPLETPPMGQSIFFLAMVLLATWYFFGRGGQGKTERQLVAAALNGGNDEKSGAAGGGGSSAAVGNPRDFVEAMQAAVSWKPPLFL